MHGDLTPEEAEVFARYFLSGEMQARRTPERVHRLAASAAARHWGTEAVSTYPIAQKRIDQVFAARIIGRDPRGWNIVDDDWLLVTVHDDDSATIESVPE